MAPAETPCYLMEKNQLECLFQIWPVLKITISYVARCEGSRVVELFLLWVSSLFPRAHKHDGKAIGSVFFCVVAGSLFKFVKQKELRVLVARCL